MNTLPRGCVSSKASARVFLGWLQPLGVAGTNLVIVTVKSPLEGSFKSMDEMNTAMEEQNLAYSMEIMAKVLERLE